MSKDWKVCQVFLSACQHLMSSQSISKAHDVICQLASSCAWPSAHSAIEPCHETRLVDRQHACLSCNIFTFWWKWAKTNKDSWFRLCLLGILGCFSSSCKVLTGQHLATRGLRRLTSNKWGIMRPFNPQPRPFGIRFPPAAVQARPLPNRSGPAWQ